jgi:hypothetical protein
VVGPGSETNLRIEVHPARPVQVTFDISLPEGTPSDAEIKMIGNVWQLGARQGSHPNYPHMPNGSVVAVAHRGSADGATVSLSLHEGMFLNYYYTISREFDGRERSADSNWVFREVIVDAADQTIGDHVQTWRDPNQSLVTFRVRAPANTTPGVRLSSGGYWMTQVGENEWVTYYEGRPGESRTGNVNLGSGSIQTIPAGDGPVQVKFSVSVPSTTSATDSLTLVVDGRRVPMTPQAINPWVYEPDLELAESGLYDYHIERAPNSRGPDRMLDAKLAEQNVNG